MTGFVKEGSHNSGLVKRLVQMLHGLLGVSGVPLTVEQGIQIKREGLRQRLVREIELVLPVDCDPLTDDRHAMALAKA